MKDECLDEKIVEGSCKCCGEKETDVLEKCKTCFVCSVRFVEYEDPCKNCLKYWEGFDENKKDA